MRRMISFALPLLVLAVASIAAERFERPSGREIADKAQNTRINRDAMVHEERNGKRVHFSPADISGSERDWEQGVVLGVIDTDAKLGETGLPPGSYHIYAQRVGDKWMAFAEKDGQIVKDAVSVGFDAKGTVEKPRFSQEGSCVQYSHWRFCF